MKALPHQGSQLLRWLMQIEEADVGVAGNLGYILFGWLGLAAPNGAQFIGEASAARQHDDGSPLARVGKHFSARNRATTSHQLHGWSLSAERGN